MPQCNCWEASRVGICDDGVRISGCLLRKLANGQEDGDEGAKEADGTDGPFDHGVHVLMHAVEAFVESVEAVIDFGGHSVEAVVEFAAKFAELGTQVSDFLFKSSDIMFEDIQARKNLAPAVEGFFFEQE